MFQALLAGRMYRLSRKVRRCSNERTGKLDIEKLRYDLAMQWQQSPIV